MSTKSPSWLWKKHKVHYLLLNRKYIIDREHLIWGFFYIDVLALGELYKELCRLILRG